MKNWIKKIILCWLKELKILEFRTWKSPINFEQYTAVYFNGEKIDEIVWSELDKLYKTNPN